MNTDKGHTEAVRIKDKRLIELITKVLKEVSIKKLSDNNPFKEEIIEFFEDKVKENIEFWKVSDSLASELENQDELVIKFGDFKVWVKDIAGADLSKFRAKQIIGAVALYKNAFLFASEFFLEQPFPDDWQRLPREVLHEFIRQYSNGSPLPPQVIFNSIKELSKLLIEFAVAAITSNDVEKDGLEETVKFVAKVVELQ